MKKIMIVIIIVLITSIVGILIVNRNKFKPEEKTVKSTCIDITIADKSLTTCSKERNKDDYLIVRADEKIYIKDLTDNIEKISIIGQEATIEYDKEEKSIKVPDLVGTFNVQLKTKTETFYFKLLIKEMTEEAKIIVSDLKEKLIKNKNIDESILEDFRITRILEYGYYPSKPNRKYVIVDLFIKCKDDKKCVSNLYQVNDKDKQNWNTGSGSYYENGTYYIKGGTGFTSKVVQTGKLYLSLSEE